MEWAEGAGCVAERVLRGAPVATTRPAPCANICRMTAVAPEPTAVGPVTVATENDADDLVLAEMLVEEISIDGMCGVY